MEEASGRPDGLNVSEGMGIGPTLTGALRALVLGGLSSAEILAVSLVAIAAVAASWGTGALRPEDLVTEPWLRALWAGLVIAVVRPLTWLPYVGAFAGARRLAAAMGPERSPRVHAAAGHVGAVVSIAGLVVLVLLSVDGAAKFAESAAGFFAGAVRLQELGSSTGSWPVWRIMAAGAVLVLARPVVPPIRPDLSMELGSVLGFPSGKRGRVDQVMLWAALAVAVVLGGLALVAAG